MHVQQVIHPVDGSLHAGQAGDPGKHLGDGGDEHREQPAGGDNGPQVGHRVGEQGGQYQGNERPKHGQRHGGGAADARPHGLLRGGAEEAFVGHRPFVKEGIHAIGHPNGRHSDNNF